MGPDPCARHVQPVAVACPHARGPVCTHIAASHGEPRGALPAPRGSQQGAAGGAPDHRQWRVPFCRPHECRCLAPHVPSVGLARRHPHTQNEACPHRALQHPQERRGQKALVVQAVGSWRSGRASNLCSRACLARNVCADSPTGIRLSSRALVHTGTGDPSCPSTVSHSVRHAPSSRHNNATRCGMAMCPVARVAVAQHRWMMLHRSGAEARLELGARSSHGR